MVSRRFWLSGALVAVALLMAACAKGPTPMATPFTTPRSPTVTPPPSITILDREQLLVGVDSAYPPFADLDRDGNLVGVEIDVFTAVMDAAGRDFRLVDTDWGTIFTDLISGRFDAVIGGVTTANAPLELVDLSEPYFKMRQVAVALESNQELQGLTDLSEAVVGVQSRSSGEFAVVGPDAAFPLPPGNVRRYESSRELIDALFSGYVDAIITHHTVVESFVRVNPGYLRILPGAGGEPWLSAVDFRIAVPKGAVRLLDVLNQGIGTVGDGGSVDEIIHAWGFSPEFAERPRYVQDPSADSLIAAVEKVDDYTVRFVLNRPDPFFDYKLTVPAMAIHSPANLEQYGGGGQLGRNPIGTGPYRLTGWEPGQAITLTANPDYWGGAAKIGRVVVRPVADPHLRFELLRGNAAQLVENLGRADLEGLEDKPIKEVQVRYRAPVNVAFLGMNREVAPFDKREVRLAVATCVDQADLVATVYPSGTLIASQFVPPNTFGFAAGLLWYTHDAEGAVGLLSGAGYGQGLSVTLSLANVASDYLPEPERIGAAIQAQLAACHITATLQLLDPATFEEQLTAGRLAFHLAGWSTDFPGPIGFLNLHFTGRGNGKQFGAPFPEIVELLDRAASTSDIDSRRESYRQVAELLKEKVVSVPLVHGAGTLAARSNVPGLTASPVRRDSLASLGPITSTAAVTSMVYLVQGEPRSLDPTDETDDGTFAVTIQIFDTLVELNPSDASLAPGLALEWVSNETADTWEFTLRRDVRFHDATMLDADAVVTNVERIWRSDHPLHRGRTGAFRYFEALFGGFGQE